MRVPKVSKAQDFLSFVAAGRELAALHIGYESVEPYPLTITGAQPTGPGSADLYDWFRVVKMRFGGKSTAKDRSTVVYNPRITVTGIPAEAHEYTLGSRTAIEWILERYGVRGTPERKVTVEGAPVAASRSLRRLHLTQTHRSRTCQGSTSSSPCPADQSAGGRRSAVDGDRRRHDLGRRLGVPALTCIGTVECEAGQSLPLPSVPVFLIPHHRARRPPIPAGAARDRRQWPVRTVLIGVDTACPYQFIPLVSWEWENFDVDRAPSLASAVSMWIWLLESDYYAWDAAGFVTPVAWGQIPMFARWTLA